MTPEFIKDIGKNKHNKKIARYRCFCGEEFETLKTYVRTKETKSCGCLSQRIKIGDIFGKLEVVDLYGKTKNGTNKWKCICECGNITIVDTSKLTLNRTKSCGCLRKKTGSSHHLWNHNKTSKQREDTRSTEEYFEWRRSVYIRDKYTCRVCLKYSGKLNAHHLDGYEWCIEKRTDIDNGITLCEECHNDFHLIYGKKKNTKYQFIEFYWDYLNDN